MLENNNEDRILSDITDDFEWKKENKTIKDIILRKIRNFFENKEEHNYYKPVRISKFLE